MRQFVIIASLQRGALANPEPLDDAGQWRASQQADVDDAEDHIRLAYRATAGFRFERDKPLREDETLTSKKPPSRVDRMMEIARKVG